MKHILAALTFLAAGAASAGMNMTKMEIPAGTLVVEPGALMLDTDTLYQEAKIRMFDLGEAGVLIQGDSGATDCAFSYQVVNKATGALRELAPAADRPTQFAQCEHLVQVIPSLGTVVFSGRAPEQVVSIWTWTGATMAQTVIERAAAPVAVARPKRLEQWEGGYLTRMLADAEARAHLATSLRPEELRHAELLAHQGEPIYRECEFLIAGACHSTDCTWRWVMIGLRVTDGAVFALLAEDGIDVIKPDGEDLPQALALALEMGELP